MIHNSSCVKINRKDEKYVPTGMPTADINKHVIYHIGIPRIASNIMEEILRICRLKRYLSYNGVKVIVFYATFSYIMAVSFIGGENRSTRRIPPSYRKSLTNFIT